MCLVLYPQLYEVGNIIPILQMKKLKHRWVQITYPRPPEVEPGLNSQGSDSGLHHGLYGLRSYQTLHCGVARLEPAVNELCGLEPSMVLRTVGTTPGTSLPWALGTLHLPRSSATGSTLHSGSGVLGPLGK